MATVVISEFMAPGGRAMLEQAHTVMYDPEMYRDRNLLLGSLADADALIVRNQTQVDEQLLAQSPRLGVVGRLGVGLDNIDVRAAASRGIAVHPAPGANAVAVAEYVIGALFVLLRPAFGAAGRLIGGEWPRAELVGHELQSRRLGLVGFGAVARLVAQRAGAIGMDVGAYDPFVPASDPAWDAADHMELDDLLASSDAVSLHVPLTESTEGLIDAQAISAMKPGAIVINTSRGGVVDEPALADALRSGALGGAALDVFAVEPLDEATRARFADVPNLLLTPHVAGHTTEANDRVATTIAAAVLETLGAQA